LRNRLANQGGGNQNNTLFQFTGYDAIESSSKTILAVPGTYLASGIFFETGLVGVVPWIPQLNRKALDPNKIMNTVGDFGMFMLPEYNIPVAVSAYATRGDSSAVGGSVQDVKIQYELSIDLGFSFAPVSVLNGSPIFTSGVLLV
jgi:hypothetical protein